MTQLHSPTEPGTPLRIAFVPSHHFGAVGPGSDFAQRVDTLWSYLSQHVFFKRYLSRIAAWRLDATRSDDMSPQQSALFAHEPVVLQWVQSAVPGFDPQNGDTIVFFVGQPAAGNVSGHSRLEKRGISPYEAPVNWVTMAIGEEVVLVHEFSHAFGHLGDEYQSHRTIDNTVPPAYPNVADKSPGCTCQDKWGAMWGLEVHPHPDQLPAMGPSSFRIGCYPDANAPNWSKPTDGPTGDGFCLMGMGGRGLPQFAYLPFCPVCQRHLEQLIHRYGTGETVVTFDRYPDGARITQPVLLQGPEFLAYGVALAPDPEHYAPAVKAQPAILPGAYGATQHCLAMVLENDPAQHVARNIRLAFDWPLQAVTITFHGATARYHLEAYDQAGHPIPGAVAYQDAVLHQGPHTITVRDAQNRIRQVEFGEDQSVTIITELRYR
ncbi:MAG: M64 family metallopeptidase [Chloroflexi bacterium]|nr:M64 family metallopeptidase [Chloroflexota bacterium]